MHNSSVLTWIVKYLDKYPKGLGEMYFLHSCMALIYVVIWFYGVRQSSFVCISISKYIKQTKEHLLQESSKSLLLKFECMQKSTKRSC